MREPVHFRPGKKLFHFLLYFFLPESDGGHRGCKWCESGRYSVTPSSSSSLYTHPPSHPSIKQPSSLHVPPSALQPCHHIAFVKVASFPLSPPKGRFHSSFTKLRVKVKSSSVTVSSVRWKVFIFSSNV